jgi:fumarate reductase subunit D
MARSNEPFWWALFSAGMMVGALLVPALVVITGFLPLGAERMQNLLNHPLTRLLLFIVISLSFFHWAHRFRFTLVDLGLKGASPVIAVVCYGSAIVGTVLSGLFALHVL